MEWLQAKYEDNNSISKSLMLHIQENQLGLFYREIYMAYNGGAQRFIIQKALADKLEKEPNIKNAVLRFRVVLLGFLNNNDDYFLITGYDKNATPQNLAKNDYTLIKNAIIDERYDYATTKLQSFLKNHPDSLEARKDICLIEFAKYQKFLDNNTLLKAIECLEGVNLLYKKPEINYMLGLLYYQHPLLESAIKINKSLTNLDQAIEQLDKVRSLTLDDNITRYNSLYLRGAIRLEHGDRRGLDDLSLVEIERPDLVNLDVFEKK
jgi:hypothetical protein